ncbi:MAG: prephenate dehydrogenase [Methanobacterium sp.]|uniref:prephenate dehydrogenase n=1 Tax=Methanobacterium sp. TaxID=2164 RepID=UPI003C78598C
MKIAIIGGTRGLGKWIASFLSNKGFDVVITGRNVATGESVSKKLGVDYTWDNIQVASTADVVIIAIPIDITPKIIREIAPLMKEGSLLLDVTSVKMEPSKVMQEYAAPGVEVLPTHPMFGPRIRSLDGQVVVLTPVKTGQWYDKVFKFLESENSKVIVTTPEIHDRMMSIVQGLTHFAYICIASTIKKLDIDVKESRKFASPIYNLMLDTIARITAQNPYLVYSIQTKNSFIKEAHETFLETFVELKDMISKEDEKGFVREMSSAAKHLDDVESALGRSDKAISALTEELSILKNLVGQEVGLRHIYSGIVHIGILDELTPDYLIISRNNSTTQLKISNVEVINNDDLYKWKLKNYAQNSLDISAIFPESCDPEVISETIKKLDGVVDAEVIDTYCGNQIPAGKISVTIRYHFIDSMVVNEVERLLKGFGSQIR